MQIPPDAIIADSKLTEYLLVERNWSDKSRFLGRAGFTRENWIELCDAIRRMAGSFEAAEDGENEYGRFYRMEGMLTGPYGTLPVTLIWMQRAVDGRFYFVTLKPSRERQL